MRFVATKSEQQSGLMLHRNRRFWFISERCCRMPRHMAELGIISAKGRNGTAELLKIIAGEQDGRIPAAARFSLDVLARRYAVVRAEIVAIEKRIHAWHRSSEESRRLEEIPGVGPIVVTGLVAEIEIGKSSLRAAVSLRESAWCRDSIRPGAKRDSAASRSKAIDICAGCSSPAPWQSSDMRASTARSGSGSLA
jgi:transposase